MAQKGDSIQPIGARAYKPETTTSPDEEYHVKRGKEEGKVTEDRGIEASMSAHYRGPPHDNPILTGQYDRAMTHAGGRRID